MGLIKLENGQGVGPGDKANAICLGLFSIHDNLAFLDMVYRPAD